MIKESNIIRILVLCGLIGISGVSLPVLAQEGQQTGTIDKLNNSQQSKTNHGYELAIADYGQAIKLNPRDAWAYCNRGIVYYDQKQYELAIADFDQAIKLDPSYTKAYSYRDRAYHAHQYENEKKGKIKSTSITLAKDEKPAATAPIKNHDKVGAAYDYEPDLKAAFAQQKTAYGTFYVGMPVSDFKGAFINLSDWKQTREAPVNGRVDYRYERLSSVDDYWDHGGSVIERIEATSVDGRIRNFVIQFQIRDRETAQKLQQKAYEYFYRLFPRAVRRNITDDITMYYWDDAQDNLRISLHMLPVTRISDHGLPNGIVYIVRSAKRGDQYY
jgi:tetratricopeptide (TPR) repeat protein